MVAISPHFAAPRGAVRWGVGRFRAAWLATTTARLAIALAALLGARSATAGTLVTMNFANFGTIRVAMFDQVVPTTVNNFVARYVAAGRYDNTIIHRIDNGQGQRIIQGGLATTSFNAVVTDSDPKINLEYNVPNTRGTIGMARTNDVNSAQSQWFINTDDNSSTFAPPPGQVGGYTVFGRIVGPTGLSVLDAIKVVPTFGYQSPFGQLPLQDFTQADFGVASPFGHTVNITSMTVASTSAPYQNPVLAADVDCDGKVKSLDALLLVNMVLKQGSHTLSSPFLGQDLLNPNSAENASKAIYVDVDGNGKINTLDAVTAITALLHASPTASPAAMQFAVVPEPSSIALAAVAAAGLAAYGWRRRQRRVVAEHLRAGQD